MQKAENILEKVMPEDAFSRKVMEERSALLSKEVIDTATIEEAKVSYVCFTLGNNEVYGVAYKDISDVTSAVHITPVPMSPVFVKGVIYWHGKLIPIINLAAYFNIPEPSQKEAKLIATVKYDKSIVGIQFDDVVGVDAYLHESLDKTLAINNHLKEQYVHGIHHGKITILNINQVVMDLTEDLLKFKGAQP